MKRYAVPVIALLAVVLLAAPVVASEVDFEEEGFEVYISTYRQPIFRINYAIHTSAQERSVIIQRRVNAVLNILNRELAEGEEVVLDQVLEDVRVIREDGLVKLMFRDMMILTVDLHQATHNDTTREGLAEVWRDNLRRALASYLENKEGVAQGDE